LSKKKPDNSAALIADAVYQYKGQISVDVLAKECNVSNRTLERYFLNNMGIGPKEFINIVRFREVMIALQNGSTSGEFAKIAVEMGYYDQSHFIKEVKKRAGSIPSALDSITNFP
jgi:transcriptional regulator GlxA family with amidase domain